MSPCHHPLLLPHISSIMFSISPSSIASPGSQLAHAGTSREDNWRKITVQAQSDGKYWKQAVDGLDRYVLPHVSASCHSLTDKLTFGGASCPFQSEFIEGDFDLLHEATAVVHAICHLDCMADSLGESAMAPDRLQIVLLSPP